MKRLYVRFWREELPLRARSWWARHWWPSRIRHLDQERQYWRSQVLYEVPDVYDLSEMAWVIIANAYGGDWESAPDEWSDAARKWRDEYHATLPSASDEEEEVVV